MCVPSESKGGDGVGAGLGPAGLLHGFRERGGAINWCGRLWKRMLWENLAIYVVHLLPPPAASITRPTARNCTSPRDEPCRRHMFRVRGVVVSSAAAVHVPEEFLWGENLQHRPPQPPPQYHR